MAFSNRLFAFVRENWGHGWGGRMAGIQVHVTKRQRDMMVAVRAVAHASINRIRQRRLGHAI